MASTTTSGSTNDLAMPEVTPEQFERLSADQAAAFLLQRFRAFVSRGLDCNTALQKAVRL
jgi:hypothetical protein